MRCRPFWPAYSNASATGQLTGITAPNGIKLAFAYDGSLLTSDTSLYQTQFVRDALGRITAKTETITNTTTVYSYTYALTGRLVEVKQNGATTASYTYDANNVISRFIYASRANAPDYMIKGGVTYRIISDHLGSPRLVINLNTGAVVQRMDYDEFSKVISDTSPEFQPFGFAGGVYDQNTGLVRFGWFENGHYSG